MRQRRSGEFPVDAMIVRAHMHDFMINASLRNGIAAWLGERGSLVIEDVSASHQGHFSNGLRGTGRRRYVDKPFGYSRALLSEF